MSSLLLPPMPIQENIAWFLNNLFMHNKHKEAKSLQPAVFEQHKAIFILKLCGDPFFMGQYEAKLSADEDAALFFLAYRCVEEYVKWLLEEGIITEEELSETSEWYKYIAEDYVIYYDYDLGEEFKECAKKGLPPPTERPHYPLKSEWECVE